MKIINVGIDSPSSQNWNCGCSLDSGSTEERHDPPDADATLSNDIDGNDPGTDLGL
jgi:hypothetical protein